MSARFFWIWTALHIIATAMTLPRWNETQDHMVSTGAAVATAMVLALQAIRVTRHRREGEIVSLGTLVWRKLRANRAALTGMAVIVTLLYVALWGPFAAPHDPYLIDWGKVAAGPTAENIFGTDDLGRDVLSRAIFGLRVVIAVAVLAVVVNILLGTFFGMVAGYYGGAVDAVIMRFLEMWNSIPFILLAIALMAALGTGLLNLVLVVSLSGIMQLARLVRGQVLVVRESQFVDAARVMGIPGPQIMVRHILPHTVAPLVVMSTLKIGETILTISGLSFLGLGIQAPTPSLGAMLSTGQQFLYQNVFMAVVPGVLILLTVLSFNLFGDGLRDAFDTRLTR